MHNSTTAQRKLPYAIHYPLWKLVDVRVSIHGRVYNDIEIDFVEVRYLPKEKRDVMSEKTVSLGGNGIGRGPFTTTRGGYLKVSELASFRHECF